MSRTAWLTASIVVLLGAGLYLAYDRGARGDRPRSVKAEADLRTLASAVSSYQRHTGGLPPALNDLLVPVTNAANVVAGPLLGTLPVPPTGWSAYRYERRSDGTFEITSSGDGRTVSLSGP